MDLDSSITEPRHRAVSSESCPSVRPSPFNIGNDASRKRRRTSQSSPRLIPYPQVMESSSTPDNRPCSRNLAVSPISDDDDRVSTAEGYTSDLELDSGSHAGAPITDMTVADSASVTQICPSPATPEPRNVQGLLGSSPAVTSIPARTVATTPGRIAGHVTDLANAPIMASVEAPDSLIHATSHHEAMASSSPMSSSLGTTERPSIVATSRGIPLQPRPSRHRRSSLAVPELDPSYQFPFQEHPEPMYDSLLRIHNMMLQLSIPPMLFRTLSQWLSSYLLWANSVGADGIRASFTEHAELWSHFPAMLGALNNRKQRQAFYGSNGEVYEAFLEFLHLFGKLTVVLVGVDISTLRYAVTTNGPIGRDAIPESLAGPYLQKMVALASLYGPTPSRVTDSTVTSDLSASMVQKFRECLGQDLWHVYCDLLEKLYPHYPQIITWCGEYCHFASVVAHESQLYLVNPSLSSQDREQLNARLAESRGIFDCFRPLVEDALTNHASKLTPEVTTQLIIWLSELYHCSFNLRDAVSKERLSLFRAKFSCPSVTEEDLPQVVAFHWRFDMWTYMLKSGLLQLRVAGVTRLSADLVSLWRTYGTEDYPVPPNPVAAYFASYLLASNVIEYILGATCHPEITSEAGNIVGYLAINHRFSRPLADLFWKTVTTSEDPRVCEALLAMMTGILRLLTPDDYMYFAQMMKSLPIEAFTPGMRDFMDHLLGESERASRNPDLVVCSADYPPFSVVFRLLRESSTPPINSDVYFWSANKFRELIKDSDSVSRRDVIDLCLDHIQRKPATSLGSMLAMWAVLSQGQPQELTHISRLPDLPRILTEEIEYAVEHSAATSQMVFSSRHSKPRNDIIAQVIIRLDGAISPDVGLRLWTAMVGNAKTSREDRDAAWIILNMCVTRINGYNSFLRKCCTEYFPKLDVQFFCSGALEFLLGWVVPKAREVDGQAMDDPTDPGHAGIEQLWRFALNCSSSTVEKSAILALVHDIYLENPLLRSSQSERVKAIHLALVNRCLSQLKDAAQKLKSLEEGTPGSDDDSLVIVGTRQEACEQQTKFVRSLRILQKFMEAYRADPELSSPDLRAVMLDSPQPLLGQPTGLKYQCFEDTKSTGILPLDIGCNNTIASLLAMLKQVSGFENFRVFYKGAPFRPIERDRNRWLSDIDMTNGLILVQQTAASKMPSKMHTSITILETELLCHFQEFWKYLSMSNNLIAQEMYSFLIQLPADEKLLLAMDSDQASFGDMVEIGQPFPCLYAAHVIVEYAQNKYREAMAERAKDNPDLEVEAACSKALCRSLLLIISAFTHKEIIDNCPRPWDTNLCTSLCNCYLQILERISELGLFEADTLLSAPVAVRLIDLVLSINTSADLPLAQPAVYRLSKLFKVITESAGLSNPFYHAFISHSSVELLLSRMLVDSPQAIRMNAAQCLLTHAHMQPSLFATHLWPLLLKLVRKATGCGPQIEELLALVHKVFCYLLPDHLSAGDIGTAVQVCTNALLLHSSTEDMTRPAIVDNVAQMLVLIMASGLEDPKCPPLSDMFESDTAIRLFWKHLFPRLDREEARSVIFSVTRANLCGIILHMVKGKRSDLAKLISALHQLIKIDHNVDGNKYLHDLDWNFEPRKHVRATSGYSGLKNLSNTCYFNSLLTQLCMNAEFRQFMFDIKITEPNGSQSLLFQTQRLFGYLQESMRRCYEPNLCVSSIRTYEDSQIDVNNQMDVDEFYNLLCDRWEGQLCTAEDKRRFRSFYGGQLVQQVKSKECEHVSERIEPFAAIQCDIKGKANLQASLEAYVDGEIMEGDNKYKCSNCDRHVDAVKRACFKEIPDNLIFHLKRFDFHIRTLTRSKINDYFAFPPQIDMRPFTVDHLEGRSNGEVDMFELVGILVHSGTAEGGHYVSYVKDRSPGSQGWLEFNDDVVTNWDPSNTESMCFGGINPRASIDPNNYERSWNAYMLFYQRIPKNCSDATSPVRISLKPTLPAKLDACIRDENVRMMCRHALYDPSHLSWVIQVLETMKCSPCSEDHSMETEAIQMAVAHLDQVASRAKEMPQLGSFVSSIRMACADCPHCALAVVDYFCNELLAVQSLVQRHPEREARLEAGRLFLWALNRVKTQLPHKYHPQLPAPSPSMNASSVMHRVCELFQQLLLCPGESETIFSFCGSNDVFGVMYEFAEMGRSERGMLLDDADILYKLLCAVVADVVGFDLPEVYQRLAACASAARRTSTKPVPFDNLCSLLRVLLDETAPNPDSEEQLNSPQGRYQMAVAGNDPIPLTCVERSLITAEYSENHGNIFIDKLGALGQTLPSIDAIVARLLKWGSLVDPQVAVALKFRINNRGTSGVPRYLRMARVYVMCSSFAENVTSLINHIAGQCSLGLNGADGNIFLSFFQLIHNLERPGTGLTSAEACLESFATIPLWVPGIIDYHDQVTRANLEKFLVDNLFSHGAAPTNTSMSEDENKLQNAMNVCARTLAHSCITYLYEVHVQTMQPIYRESLAVFCRVVENCEPYFQVEGSEFVSDLLRLQQNVTAILEALEPLLADEMDDDGSVSEWEASLGSSDAVDGVPDLMTLGDDEVDLI